MDSHPAQRDLASAETTMHPDERLVFADSWQELDTGQERRDNWMLSYIDILTLLLTLLVLLLVLQPKHESPVSGGIPALAGLAALAPVEPSPVDVLQDYQLQAGRSIALIEALEEDPGQALAAEWGIDAAAAGVEPETVIQATLGSMTLLALESLMVPQRPAHAMHSDPVADPTTPPVAVSAQTAVTAVAGQSTSRVSGVQADAFARLRSALTENGLYSRLKVSQIAEGMHLEVSDQILFAEGSAQLRSEGQNLLHELAHVLLQHRGMISVEGHTDARPIASSQFPSNWELSSGRATAVTRYLVNEGLDAQKLRAVGYADTRPLESNATVQGRMRNRRVSLILVPAQ